MATDVTVATRTVLPLTLWLQHTRPEMLHFCGFYYKSYRRYDNISENIDTPKLYIFYTEVTIIIILFTIFRFSFSFVNHWDNSWTNLGHNWNKLRPKLISIYILYYAVVEMLIPCGCCTNGNAVIYFIIKQTIGLWTIRLLSCCWNCWYIRWMIRAECTYTVILMVRFPIAIHW